MPGQMYMAWGRIANLSGMYLKGKYTESAIKAGKTADKEYIRTRTEQ